MHQLTQQGLGRFAQARSWPASMGLRNNRPGRTVLAEHFLNERDTDPEHVR